MLTKFASAAHTILSADLAPGTNRGDRRALARVVAKALPGWDHHSTGVTFDKTAHRHPFEYDPRPGYLYVRSRAISSRCNDNFDEFPADEIRKAYSSFVGKPVFVNHNNDNHRRARGVIIDAALHEDVNPDGSPDTWVEVLMEVDAVRFPKLAQAILAQHIDRTSMGTDVAFSVCSYCGNKATTPLEYCQHIPKLKGQRIYRTTASGEKEGVLVREICHGLGFFENSLLVEEPADPTAFFLGVDDRGLVGTAARADNWHDLPPEVIANLVAEAATPGIDNRDHVRGFQNRDIPQQGDRVAVYRDLSDAPRSGFDPDSSFSMKSVGPTGTRSGTVQSHTTGVHLKNVVPDFDEAARRKAMETGKRGVHAYVHGTVHQYVGQGGVPKEPGWEPVSYYPDLGKFFMANGRHEFQGADEAVLANGRMSVRGNVRKGEPVPLSPKYEQQKAASLHPDALSLSYVAARTLIFKHPRTGEEYRRTTNADYTHVSIRNGEIRWHNSESSARQRGGEVYPVEPQSGSSGGGGGGGGGTKGRPNPKTHKTLWDHMYDHHKARIPYMGGTDEENHVRLREIHNREHAEGKDHAGFGFSPLNHHHGAKLAYGETMAPAQVDTLREELCPVCGEEDSFDGQACQVCNFVKPPDVFMDPDLDAAKVNDLRQEQDDEAIPGGGDLECPECGDTFASEHGAQTPQALDAFVPPGQTGNQQEADQAPGTQPPAQVSDDGDTPKAKETPSLPKSSPDPKAGDSDDGPPDTEPKAGDDCPTCGKGKLQPKKDGDAKSNPPAKSDGNDDPDSKKDADDKDGKDDKDDKSKPPWLKNKKSQLAATAALSHEGEDVMRPALAALAEQQKVIASQQAIIISMASRLSATENSLYELAKAAGFEDHPSIAAMASARQEAQGLRLASLAPVTADENNPAQPIPENGSEAPSQSTDQARQPAATDDPQKIGDSPLTDVSADATADPQQVGGTVLDEGLNLNEKDPTKMVSGTDTLGEGAAGEAGTNRTDTDVQFKAPNTDVPFKETGWTNTSGRAFASLRLARLRIQAGIEDGSDADDITLGEQIAGDASMTDETINAEINTLSAVVPKLAAAAQAQRQASRRPAARSLVPQAAQQVGRAVPSMVTEPAQHTAANEGGEMDEALFE